MIKINCIELPRLLSRGILITKVIIGFSLIKFKLKSRILLIYNQRAKARGTSIQFSHNLYKREIREISKHICLFLFLILSSHSNLFAQDSQQKQYELALNLFKNEKYFDAITEFKRLLFFDKDSIYTFEANELVGKSYKAGGKFSEAITYLTYAELNAHNKEEMFRINIEIVRVNILRRTTGRALQILDELEKDTDFSSKKNEVNYWRGWTYIFADEWNKAAISFSQIDTNHELKLLSEKVEAEKYSVNLAKVMSVIIPGAGQFYTGNYLSGLISLGWNLLWGFITVNSFVEERIFDGFAVGNLLWLRFYRGNIENAGDFAKEKNLEISNKALFYLQNDYTGLKP